jgi:predicted small integral membrane protein
MTIRLLKTSMVFAVGLWALLVAVGNILDYDSNWHFVQHVLSMDTVFPDNALKYRAITNPTVQGLGYWVIIATEWVMSVLCLAGAWALFRARRDRGAFIAAKSLAACGLVLVFLMYFVGFVVVGGEWFCMWQSEIWNGQTKAVMFLTCAMLVLIVLLMREEDAIQAGAAVNRPPGPAHP